MAITALGAGITAGDITAAILTIGERRDAEGVLMPRRMSGARRARGADAGLRPLLAEERGFAGNGEHMRRPDLTV